MPTIVHFDIATDDPARASKFYKSLFDWKMEAPPGMEWQILRKIPGLLLAATIAPLLVAWGARLWLADAKQIMSIDIFCFAIAVTMWTALLTIAIGCVVVHIMKGPAYAADSYEVSHADRPRSGSDHSALHESDDL